VYWSVLCVPAIVYLHSFAPSYNLNLITNANNRGITRHDLQGHLLHCQQGQPLASEGKSQYALLNTGCGYSGTGYVAKIFSAAGYDVGHEVFGRHGSSNWLAASPRNHMKPHLFTAIFLGVRHPLKVVQSCRGSKWNFRISSVPYEIVDDFSRDAIPVWNDIHPDAKCLEWWATYTSLGQKIAHCWFLTQDLNPELAYDMCVHAKLDACTRERFVKAGESVQRTYNMHRKDNSEVTWEELGFRV